jgi:hypothetical protein
MYLLEIEVLEQLNEAFLNGLSRPDSHRSASRVSNAAVTGRTERSEPRSGGMRTLGAIDAHPPFG